MIFKASGGLDNPSSSMHELRAPRQLYKGLEIFRDAGLSKDSAMVFYDVLGFFLVYYPAWFGTALNLAVAALAIGVTCYKVANAPLVGMALQYNLGV